MSDLAAVDTRAKCRRCGRTVWFRLFGINGYTSAHHAGEKVYRWCARKGAKPRPVTCPDGRFHEVYSFASSAYESDLP